MVEYEDRGRGTRARERDAIMRSTNLDSDLVILHAEGFRTFLEGSVEVEAPVLLYAHWGTLNISESLDYVRGAHLGQVDGRDLLWRKSMYVRSSFVQRPISNLSHV